MCYKRICLQSCNALPVLLIFLPHTTWKYFNARMLFIVSDLSKLWEKGKHYKVYLFPLEIDM